MSTNKPRDLKSRSKRRRSESERDASKHDLADQPREYKNKRQKSKRAASPTPSYLSMKTDWSMDPPTNFKTGEMFPSHSRGRAASPTPTMKTDWSMDPPTNFKTGEMFPLHSRTKRRRETSPVTSYMSLRSGNSSTPRGRAASPTPTMKTDWSMDPPTNFKTGLTLPVHARGRADSPTPTLKTDWSMDPPTNFKPAETLPLDSRLLSEHYLRCPLCKSMLKDPVSISCGHNYCRDCIDAFWDNCAEDYVCPHCGKSSEMRPVLNTNIALAEVVKNLQQAGFSPALPPQSYAGPEDVPCDFCSERRLKAVKSCSNCEVFLCETHIRQHYTIAALQKHTLSDVTGDMKTKPSQQQNTVSNFSGITRGQQDQTDKTQVNIKETPVKSFSTSVLNATKLQSHPKKSVKISRPKSKDVVNKDVKHLARVCSTLRQEVSGLKNSLSQFSKGKNTKKEKHYEEDYGDEDDDEDYSEKDSDERSDDEESHDEDEDGFDEEEADEGSRDDEEDGSENYHDEEDDSNEEEADEGSRDDEEDGSENYDEEDGFDEEEEEGDEGSRDDQEDNSEYNDEGSDDRYSDGSNDHSYEEFSGEDDDY